jgi:LysR family nitrogen assimilation transcriptional regulator
VLEQFRSIEEEIGRDAGELRGSVTVGLPAPTANVLLIPLFRRVGAAHPQIRLRFEEARTISLLEGLLAGHFDLAVTANEGESGRIEAVSLGGESLHVVGAAGSGLGETIEFARLFELPLAISSQVNEQRTAMSLIARRMKGRLDIVLESTSLPTTKRLVADGDLYAIMTWSAVADEVAAGSLRAARIVNPELPRPLFLCQVRDRRHSSAVQAVAGAVQEAAAEVARAGIWR